MSHDPSRLTRGTHKTAQRAGLPPLRVVGTRRVALRAEFRSPPGRSADAASTEAFTEPLDTTTRIDELLPTRVKRMAVRANVQVHIAAQGRTRINDVATAASSLHRGIRGMNIVFHDAKAPFSEGAQCTRRRGLGKPASVGAAAHVPSRDQTSLCIEMPSISRAVRQRGQKS